MSDTPFYLFFIIGRVEIIEHLLSDAVSLIIVLFFRRGIMGDRELPDLFKKRSGKEAAGK